MQMERKTRDFQKGCKEKVTLNQYLLDGCKEEGHFSWPSRIACEVIQRRESMEHVESQPWFHSWRRGYAKSQKMTLEGESGADFNGLCTLAEEF